MQKQMERAGHKDERSRESGLCDRSIELHRILACKPLTSTWLHVNATVRDPYDRKKTEHLLALDGANERLHLFKAELLEEGSFDSAVEGCIGVFHTFLLVILAPRIRSSIIKRVIITSSLAAVMLTGKPLADDVVADETWFSDPVVCEKLKDWYMLSKTLAERAAWKFSEEKVMDMVTINPDTVLGPLLLPTLNTSVEPIAKLVGAETFRNATCRLADVRDVANAHIFAFENPLACGRYCVAGKPTHSCEIFKMLRELYPHLNLPQKYSDENLSMPAFPAFQVSQERVKSLGIKFTSLEVSLKDTVDSLMAKNLLSV
ncbi:hypothetical protein Golob_022834 [Gossypium lobatum]|uniref:NAD-dependent epimerase/dehydratase domain-containing protein n=1 Tax=Gossypium lobatum TaxID=34289 RepID=A0A7J8LHV4_9ROSI|nr:hypothetical protein [Gossypium lobatum]